MVDGMLFEQRLWAGLADGTVTVTFRRWKRPRARVGGSHRTPAGVLAVDAVAEVDPADITEDDAHAAGFGSLAELLRQLDRHGQGPVYRVDFHHAGADPREALRRRAPRSWPGCGPPRSWTTGCTATGRGLAREQRGRERQPFKADVRKLKELGLTESLEVGYRLSPRGRALLARHPGALPGRDLPDRHA